VLYDNAHLARVYLHAWQVTGEPFYRAIVGEPDLDDTQALLVVAHDGYRPFQVVGLGAPSPQPSTVPPVVYPSLSV
jgi:hypothetical protein